MRDPANTVACPLMSEASAIAIGVLALQFLEEAEQAGRYRRGSYNARPADDIEAKHFYDLEVALKAIEDDLGRRIV